MPWLKIAEGETVRATIDLSSIKTVIKHWTGQRSELCLAEGCPHCARGLPKRWRYQARLLVKTAPYSWEFGEQTMTEIQQLPHDTHWAAATITRIGEGRQARNQISPAPVEQAPAHSKYKRGKYGHLVQS